MLVLLCWWDFVPLTSSVLLLVYLVLLPSLNGAILILIADQWVLEIVLLQRVDIAYFGHCLDYVHGWVVTYYDDYQHPYWG